MVTAFVWPALAIAAAGLQVARNAAQRGLTERLGVWGAAYVRFVYGLPFALVWAGLILAWRGWSDAGAFNTEFFAWTLLGASTQAAATALLVLAMRGRAFPVATGLSKTEVFGAALVGIVLINDVLSVGDWIGAALGTLGVVLMAHVSVNRAAFNAAMAGIGSGLLFAFSSVSYRGASLAFGGDPWVAAAMCLVTALTMQTIGGALAMGVFARPALAEVARAWKPSLIPGATGAIASACLFSAFALGPSAAAVKTVQLVDVLIAWGVSHRFMQERVSRVEIVGAGLILAGAIAVLLA